MSGRCNSSWMDFGFGATMAGRMRCAEENTAANARRAKGEETRQAYPSFYQTSQRLYVMLYGMTGYAGNIVSRMWRGQDR